jgi:hydroxymethylbilane synthase
VSSARSIVVGTRGSALALWQARRVVDLLQARHPDRSFTLSIVRTRGDAVREVPLAELGARGVFVKEIESLILSGEVDVGVHSLKDLPSELSPGLALAMVTAREDPRDALVSRCNRSLAELPAGARLGTGSPRRAAQLLALRPDLVVEGIRGNVDTRVRKVLEKVLETELEGEGSSLDGVILALAGLRRLGLEDKVAERIPLAAMVPAPGQGIIGVEARSDDEEVLRLTAAIDDVPSHRAARAERAYVRVLGGLCTTPLGAYAVARDDVVEIQGVLASPDGRRVLRAEATGDAADSEAVGAALARKILAMGGAELLAELERGQWNGLGGED